jgi:hypothetical protein
MTRFGGIYMSLRANGTYSKYVLILIFSTALILSYSAAGNVLLKKTSATINDPSQITNDQVKDSYLVYIKEKINKGPNSECQPGLGVGVLQGDDIICNPGLLNQQNKLNELGNQVEELDDGIVSKLSDKLDKKKEIIADKFEKLRERMEKAISEEEEENPLPEDVQKLIDKEDQETVDGHQSKGGEHCRDGNVLNGASNEEDLKVLAECQDAVGDVMHTKKMDDGDYKFLVKLDDKYEFLVNDKNEEKTDGLLVVEVVPKDQDLNSVDLPKEGDKVHVWGAWVTDKPKGWHEIHPTWEVAKQ